MKLLCPIICLTFVISGVAICAGADVKYAIYGRVSHYGNTNTWWVTQGQAEKEPEWDEKGNPPLSVGRAISLGKSWLVSKGASTDCYVMTVQLRSMNPGRFGDEYRPCWFYIITFYQVYQFGSSATSVVWMDGSVVEPDSSDRGTNIIRYLD